MTLGKTVKRLIALLAVGLIAIGATAIGGGFAFSAKAEGTARTQSSFIGTKNGVTVTENYSHATLDSGKSGVLITSQASGDAAEGKGFSFAGTMSGAFSIDYRVFSKNDYAAGNYGAAGSGWNDDSLNPYCDLRKLSITIADTVSGKSFTIYNVGAVKYSIPSTMLSVKTGSMSSENGHKYSDWSASGGGVSNGSGYRTILYGTSFSNKGLASGGTPAAEGGLSTKIEFDPATMKVYGWLNTPSSGYTRVECLDLSKQAHVGAENVLTSNDFTKYTVSVRFEQMISNSYTDDSRITEAYDRYANMVIYSLNGQSLAGTDNGSGSYIVSNTAGAMGIPKLSADKVYAGEEFSVSLTSFDMIDGYGAYSDDIKYYTDYDETEKTLTAANGYKLNLPKYGKLTLIVPGCADSSGTVGATYSYTYSVMDKIVPVVAFSDTVQQRTQFDITGIRNSILRPEVKPTDLTVTTNGTKSYNIKIKVSTPKGTTHTKNVNSLPFLDYGVYTVQYEAVDEFGNVSVISRSFTVGDFAAPEVLVRSNELTAYAGDEVSLIPQAVLDTEEGEANYSCLVYNGNELVASGVEKFVPASEGEYKIVYKAWDGSGNESQKEIKLTVLNKTMVSTDTDYTVYIVISIVASVLIIAAGVVVFFVTRRKRRNNE